MTENQEERPSKKTFHPPDPEVRFHESPSKPQFTGHKSEGVKGKVEGVPFTHNILDNKKMKPS